MSPTSIPAHCCPLLSPSLPDPPATPVAAAIDCKCRHWQLLSSPLAAAAADVRTPEGRHCCRPRPLPAIIGRSRCRLRPRPPLPSPPLTTIAVDRRRRRWPLPPLPPAAAAADADAGRSPGRGTIVTNPDHCLSSSAALSAAACRAHHLCCRQLPQPLTTAAAIGRS